MTSPKHSLKPVYRIGIDCRMYSSQFTGIGRYTFELVENLQSLDQHHQYFLFFNEPEFNNFHSDRPNFHKVLVNARHYSLAEQTVFLRAINQQKLDLMHFTHFNRPVLYNRPSLVTIHDLILHLYPGKKMTSPIHRMAYHLTVRTAVRKAKKIIAVSRSTGADVEKYLHVPLSKIQVIPLGVNPVFQPIKDQARLQSTLQRYSIGKAFLLYTGVWRDHKNLPGLLKAFAVLRQTNPDLQLVITGRTDNIYAQDIFHLAHQLGLMNQDEAATGLPPLIFPGLVSEAELVDLLNAASVYVIPSFYEGFGMPPLEAMRCGTPVAASATPCIAEICGKNAVYFDPQSPENMAAAIQKLLTDPALYHQLQAAGLHHAQQFSWPKMATQTHQLYLHALSGR